MAVTGAGFCPRIMSTGCLFGKYRPRNDSTGRLFWKIRPRVDSTKSG
ncbi:hypothetical protein [Lactobacillus equicursoris]|nr:hypothetical protein [Lactobacillus equicursoris]